MCLQRLVQKSTSATLIAWMLLKAFFPFIFVLGNHRAPVLRNTPQFPQDLSILFVYIPAPVVAQLAPEF
jgi:hypothetical protein